MALIRGGTLMCWIVWLSLVGACAHRPAPPPEPTFAAVYGDHRGAVASVNPLATAAGLRAFAEGGNAVDAALAVAFTLGVVDSHNSGIGGGCFILARLADGRILAIDGREMAPSRASRDMYLQDGKVQADWSRVGPLAAGVPGSVAALHQLQSQGGRLSWAQVLMPAADLAERGTPVSSTLAGRLASNAEHLRRFPASAKIFLDAEGQPWQAGDRLIQRDLAQSYRAMAQRGPEWFYGGEFATQTAAWMAAEGGILSVQDFRDYRVVEREPVATEFMGYRIYGFPPPSSGGLHVAQILEFLDAEDLVSLSEADYYHLLAEAMKLAFADRAHWLGDPDFAPVPKGLLDPDYLAGRRSQFNWHRATPAVTHGQPPLADEDLFGRHTTHIATADAEGNWVAITTTLNTSFGSKVVIPGTGVLLNNQMDDFVAEPGVPNAFGLVGAEANAIAPAKRPLSSMSPTLVTRDDQPILTVGAAGGPTIISQVTQVLVRHLALRQPLAEAMAALRIHHQWQPDVLFIEPQASAGLREDLQARGHSLRDLGTFGGTQAIARQQGRFEPVTEPRVLTRERQE